MDTTINIDLSATSSPLQILKIKKEMSKITSGQSLRIKNLSNKSQKDFFSWCERVGYIATLETESPFLIIIRKK